MNATGLDGAGSWCWERHGAGGAGGVGRGGSGLKAPGHSDTPPLFEPPADRSRCCRRYCCLASLLFGYCGRRSPLLSPRCGLPSVLACLAARRHISEGTFAVVANDLIVVVIVVLALVFLLLPLLTVSIASFLHSPLLAAFSQLFFSFLLL